ncbi:hypothetical protein OAE39_02900 [Akkermansiaceae bacterium]|nr:hypothetical protein [Akkermansiaceae bacterium]
MKELWDIAIQPHNLPLTCVVGLFMVYWSICILGVFGIDTFDIDLDADLDGDAEGVVPSPVAAALRFVNATEVPLMAVLTILSVFMWVSSMMGNYYFNPELTDVLILSIFAGSFVVGVILTKMATAPLVPVFRKMKELEKAEPAVGGVGVVLSKQVDQKYGQVELKRKEGAPATLNCRTSDETPIPRGAEVIIISYDKDTGTYLVRKP